MAHFRSSIPQRLKSVANVAIATGLLVMMPISLHAQDNSRALLVSGIQTDYGEIISQAGALGQFGAEDLCRNSDMLGWAMGSLVDEVQRSMVNAGAPITLDGLQFIEGAPTRAGVAQSLRTARDNLCQDQPAMSVQPFVIAYSSCRMAMVTQQNAMDMHLPPGQAQATMSMADFTERQVVFVDLKRDLDAAAGVLGSGWTNSVQMTGATDGGERIGYDTTRYNFEYTGGPGGAGGIGELLGNSVSVSNRGQVWVSDEVPGAHIVQSFYDNLTNEINRDEASSGIFSGMIENMGGMLREGLPLEMDSTVTSSIMGRTTVSGRSHMLVTAIELVDVNPQWCTQSLMPPDYPVMDVNAQIQQSMQESGVDAAQLNEAMEEFNRAMQQMTPEQRQMMERMGVGNMMEQATGGAAGLSVPHSAPAAPAAAAAQAAPSTPGLSAALRSDNPTETVQNYLQALGYETGGASGELNIETTIAISQYQAENGLEVTGEISDQLARRLAADVDRL
ncbi:MAG: peptidoglycan-binding domain-containing protein [bacterium]